jgi:hypothetical protein
MHPKYKIGATKKSSGWGQNEGMADPDPGVNMPE